MTRWRAATVVVPLLLVSCSVDANDTTIGNAPIASDESGDTIVDNGSNHIDDTRLNEQPFVAEIPPDVDLSEHSVPLGEIVFDTFDGRVLTLPDSTPELRARLLDRIPPIDQPVYGDASEGDWLDPNDLVLGYFSGDNSYAYPVKILNFHEIVNDKIDGVPLLISYCPLCRSAVVYDRRVDGNLLAFSNTSALHEADLVMVDRETGSYWWQVRGTSIVGPLTGTELEALPSEMATWRDWTDRHPDTLVLTRDTGFTRPYTTDSFATYNQFLESGRFPFPVSDAARDDRLPSSELVIAIEIDGQVVAYPVDRLTGPIDDEVGGLAVRVVPHEDGANVFEIESDGSTGAALPARTSFWFAIASASPEVTIGP